MKDKVVYKQLSCAEDLRQAVQEVWFTEITQEYCKSLVYNLVWKPPKITFVKCIFKFMSDLKHFQMTGYGHHQRMLKNVVLNLSTLFRAINHNALVLLND